MSGDVIVSVALNAALNVSYTADQLAAGRVNPVSRPGYRAGGRGITVARVLRSFGHDVLAAGLAGGVSGELIRDDLARSGVPTAFTLIRGESRRLFRFASGEPSGPQLRFGEPGPYITTEELGRFAADYRSLLGGAAAVVLCGSLPDGLPTGTYGPLVTYAVEAGVPVVLDVGGEELKHALGHGPGLVVAQTGATEPDQGAALLRLGAGAAAVAAADQVQVATPGGGWTARLAPSAPDPSAPDPSAPDPSAPDPGHAAPAALDRGALVAGLVPGYLLGWSWPDRLRHALALAAGAWTHGPDERGGRDHVDLDAYDQLFDAVLVEPAKPTLTPNLIRQNSRESRIDHYLCARVWTQLNSAEEHGTVSFQTRSWNGAIVACGESPEGNTPPALRAGVGRRLRVIT